jgi:hypothetical protein
VDSQNLWDFTDYGLRLPWVMTASTVSGLLSLLRKSKFKSFFDEGSDFGCFFVYSWKDWERGHLVMRHETRATDTLIASKSGERTPLLEVEIMTRHSREIQVWITYQDELQWLTIWSQQIAKLTQIYDMTFTGTVLAK